MICPRCHTQNTTGRYYCASCGYRLPHACVQCSFLNDPSDRFCGGCGTSLSTRSLSDVGAKDVTALTDPSPSSTLAIVGERSRIEQLTIASPGLPGDERKTITALFADLKGSTALIEGLDPEEARALIDPALQLMMDAVHRYEGYVAQALGDGIFAVFGAPIAHEDHPQRAVYAALRMQDEMRRHSNEVKLAHGVSLAMRVGVNTGEVLMRSIPKGNSRTDYVPVGHATNVAARMEQMATPGSILITEHTKKLIEHYFELTMLGAAHLKGVETPLNVYEVVGAGPRHTRLHIAAHRGLSRFVGRQVEFQQLQTALAHAKAGHGQIVHVQGEPGLGKSRLFHEFKCFPHGCVVLETAAVSYGSASPYLPVVELLKAYFQMQPHDNDRARRERVMGKVLGLDRHLEDTLPCLFALFGLHDDPSPVEHLDPQARHRRICDAVTQLLLRESRNQPLILIVEDAQWIDRESQAVLDTLCDSLASAHILVLVNARPEYCHAWGHKPYYTQLQMTPLGAAETEAFLTNLLGSDDSLTLLKQHILSKTEGTPFFMEEVVHTLVEEQVLTGERRHYRLAQEVTDLHISPTIQGVIAGRIDRLAQEEKLLLQQLSVIGRSFPLALVRLVIAQPADELSRILSVLQRKEFLYEESALPTATYLFKHALTQEVAYNSVLLERRKTLHLQIAQAIEQIFHSQLEDYYSILAHHYSKSGEIEKAMNYLLRDLRTAWLTNLDRTFGVE